jgi:hypothetical protein
VFAVHVSKAAKAEPGAAVLLQGVKHLARIKKKGDVAE